MAWETRLWEFFGFHHHVVLGGAAKWSLGSDYLPMRPGLETKERRITVARHFLDRQAQLANRIRDTKHINELANDFMSKKNMSREEFQRKFPHKKDLYADQDWQDYMERFGLSLLRNLKEKEL